MERGVEEISHINQLEQNASAAEQKTFTTLN